MFYYVTRDVAQSTLPTDRPAPAGEVPSKQRGTVIDDFGSRGWDSYLSLSLLTNSWYSMFGIVQQRKPSTQPPTLAFGQDVRAQFRVEADRRGCYVPSFFVIWNGSASPIPFDVSNYYAKQGVRGHHRKKKRKRKRRMH